MLRERRTRALLCVGCALGLGAVSSLAYWSDTATIPTGSFVSGSLDLRIDGNLAGPGGTYVKTALTLTDMVPGESVSATLVVQSPAGTLPFGYYATAMSTGALAPGLQWTVVPGATANAGTGTQAAGNRAGTCGAGTASVTDLVLTGSSSAVIGTSAAAGRRPVVAGGSENVCLRVRLDPNAANALQSSTASATFTFTAVQMGAP